MPLLKVERIMADSRCPFCHLYKPSPTTPDAVVNHLCEGRAGERVFFLNDHAIAGTGQYNAAERASVG
jgi:hypothetical protein